MWFDTIQFHTSLFTFQSNCAEGLHFSAFHYYCDDILKCGVIGVLHMKSLCSQHMLYYVYPCLKPLLPNVPKVHLSLHDDKCN